MNKNRDYLELHAEDSANESKGSIVLREGLDTAGGSLVLHPLTSILPESPVKHQSLLYEFIDRCAHLEHWRCRLSHSRKTSRGFAAPGGEFTRALYEAIRSESVGKVKEALGDSIVVEIGAGFLPYGYLIASICGARAYVGVEPFYADHLIDFIESIRSRHSFSFSPLPYTVVPQDMKCFLENTPDDSVSVLACGIEKCIIPEQRYRKNVEREILRALSPRGAFVAYRSNLRVRGAREFRQRFRRFDSGKTQIISLWRKGNS